MIWSQVPLMDWVSVVPVILMLEAVWMCSRQDGVEMSCNTRVRFVTEQGTVGV